ncbi:MAG: hypothetical protein R2759_13390 [Bacteroidales bacterium]
MLRQEKNIGYQVVGKDGKDRLYGERLPIFIDEDIQEEYWTEIRNQPEKIGTLRIN